MEEKTAVTVKSLLICCKNEQGIESSLTYLFDVGKGEHYMSEKDLKKSNLLGDDLLCYLSLSVTVLLFNLSKMVHFSLFHHINSGI